MLENILPACQPVVIKRSEDKLNKTRKKCEHKNNQEAVIIFEGGLIITHILYESGGVSDAPQIFDVISEEDSSLSLPRLGLPS